MVSTAEEQVMPHWVMLDYGKEMVYLVLVSFLETDHATAMVETKVPVVGAEVVKMETYFLVARCSEAGALPEAHG